MAKFTYEDFEREAQAAGLLNSFSAADLKLAKDNPDAGISILNYKKDYLNATTDEMRAAANAGAENIRSSYGNYTGGSNGNGYYLNQLSPQDYDAPSAPTFEYGDAPTYESRYDQQLQEMLGNVANYGSFTYDPASDPLMQQYTKMYAREGQRATADALGQAAALTGGMPSSYATTAAAQAGNYYAAQAADKMPDLYELAYNKYLNDFNMQLSQLAAVQGAEESDYMKYVDQLNQFNTDRNFAYGSFADALAQQNNERDFAYQQMLDEINNAAYNEEAALNKAITAASVGDYSLLRNQGITPDLSALTAPEGGNGRQYTIDDIKAAAPDGNLNEKTWNALLADGWTESELSAAGFSKSASASFEQQDETGNSADTVLNKMEGDKTKVGGKWLTEAQIAEGIANGTILINYTKKGVKFVAAMETPED